MPQRRQKRAVAESDSPQLTQGWTPPAAFAGSAAVEATSRADSAQSASIPPVGWAGRPRNGRPAAGRCDGHSGWAGHCGAALAAIGSAGAAGSGVSGSAGAVGAPSGAIVCHVGCATTSWIAAASAAAAAAAATRAASASASASAWTRAASAAAAASSASLAASAAAATSARHPRGFRRGCGLGLEPGCLGLGAGLRCKSGHFGGGGGLGRNAGSFGFGRRCGFRRFGLGLEPGGFHLGCGGRLGGGGLGLTPGGLRLRGRLGLGLPPRLGRFEFGSCCGLRLASGSFGSCSRFLLGAELRGLRLGCRRGLCFAPGLGGLEFGERLGLCLSSCCLGFSGCRGFRSAPGFGGLELRGRRGFRSAPGLGGFRLGDRSVLGAAPGFGCLRFGECCGLCLVASLGGLQLGAHFRLVLESGGFGGVGVGFRLRPGGLGRGFRLGLESGRLELGSPFGLGLEPGRLGGGSGRGDRDLGFGQGGCVGLGLDLRLETGLDIRFDRLHRRRCLRHAEPREAGHHVERFGIVRLRRRGFERGCRADVIPPGDVRGRPGQGVERRDLLARVLDGGMAIRAAGGQCPAGDIDVRERGGQDLLAEVRCAGEAAALGGVPAVAAGVLPARHAEVEGLVERVELLGRGLAIGLVARRGEGLVHGRVVGQDEVLEAARHGPQALEAGDPRCRGLERVAGATTFAE